MTLRQYAIAIAILTLCAVLQLLLVGCKVEPEPRCAEWKTETKYCYACGGVDLGSGVSSFPQAYTETKCIRWEERRG